MAARGGFSSRLGFIAAAAGSAVGLGNIWKFPFEVGDGGGAAFVVIYLLFCFILCFPVMVTEVAIGRKTQKNAVGAFNALGFKRWNVVGKLGILSGVIILSFYNVVAGWAFGYFIEMVLGHFDIGQRFGEFTADFIKVGAYSILFMLATSYIVSRGVSGGIEKASKILMPALILMILSLVVYSFTLPNAMAGVEFYLVPDFSKINLAVISGALRQSFFSLSLGMGALITYGSYLSKKENIVSSSALITLADVGMAFLAGLMIFPFVAFNSGGDMSNASGGAGLIFVNLPGVFETLGGAGVVIGSLFFLLLSFAALTSTVSLLEVPVSYVVDEYKMKRSKATMIVAFIIFLIGIPSLLANGASDLFGRFVTYFNANSPTDFMTFAGHIADTFLVLGGSLIVIFAAYVWKTKNLEQELSEGYSGFSNSFVKKYLRFTISYLSPVLLILLFVLVVLSNFFGINIG
ncbi:sodium-dependent transporter [Roseivirga sp.]|uniref:sodium-dependent transporter n=1 Tax=Roseivirga sp. TaxID=1964215 RepID=UPI003B8C596E